MESLIDKVKEAGVVGAGGAGFPTHVKLNAKAEILIINGVECEPLLHVDQYLSASYPKELVEMVELIRNHVGANKAYITLKEKYVEAQQALEAVLAPYPNIEISLFPSVYPMGDEHVLVYETTKRLVPAGGIPLDVGVVVTNVETVYNVCLALEGQPVVDTYLSVVGQVPEAVTIKVPIGTEIREIIDAVGADATGLSLLEGGPMMGNLIEPDYRVQKTTKGLFLLPQEVPVIYRRKQSVDSFLKIARSACCHCNFCTENCPRYLLGHDLEPHRIMWGVSMGMAEEFPAFEGTQYCCECGICEMFSCPMEISPRRIIQHLKRTAPAERKKVEDYDTRWFRENRKVPTVRLEARLGLTDYHKPAPWKDINLRPKDVVISLKAHVGSPSEPVVKPGDSIKRGDLIGRIPEGKLGANVHASINGTVESVEGGFVRIQS